MRTNHAAGAATETLVCLPQWDIGGKYRIPPSIHARIERAIEGVPQGRQVLIMRIMAWLLRMHSAPKTLGRTFSCTRDKVESRFLVKEWAARKAIEQLVKCDLLVCLTNYDPVAKAPHEYRFASWIETAVRKIWARYDKDASSFVSKPPYSRTKQNYLSKKDSIACSREGAGKTPLPQQPRRQTVAYFVASGLRRAVDPILARVAVPRPTLIEALDARREPPAIVQPPIAPTTIDLSALASLPDRPSDDPPERRSRWKKARRDLETGDQFAARMMLLRARST